MWVFFDFILFIDPPHMSPEGNDPVRSHRLAAQSLLILDRSQQVGSHKVTVMEEMFVFFPTSQAFNSG